MLFSGKYGFSFLMIDMFLHISKCGFIPFNTLSSFSYLSGDNLMSMLLKPSYTAQESKEVLKNLILILLFKIMM